MPSSNDPMAVVLQYGDSLNNGGSKAMEATNEEYHKKAHIHRQAALENTHLIATDPWLLD